VAQARSQDFRDSLDCKTSIASGKILDLLFRFHILAATRALDPGWIWGVIKTADRPQLLQPRPNCIGDKTDLFTFP
jgi:hypothetical protein